MAGFTLIPHIGIEGDEALFAAGIYQPRAELYTLHIGHSHVPIMLMSYLGALKSWIYRPIFNAFGAGPITLRAPMLLVGVASLWLFFLLVRRVAGEFAALIGCALLSVDSMYLVTVCFDWGPVALQHLLLVGGMLLLIRFYQQGGEPALFGGFFLLGLALWDKALAVWMLSGMGIAGILTLRRQILGTITLRRAAISAVAFVLGSMPLVVYNAGNHWATFRGTFHRDTSQIAGKALFLKNTAGGPGLFGWMTSTDWQTPAPHQPHGALETVSAGISALFGQPRHHLLLYGFALALLLTPWVRGNALRVMAFSLITMAVAWVQMAITANTGASVHHTILLWPLPELVIAVSFASASRRLGRAGIPALGAVVAVMLVSGALVINEYYTNMVRYGGAWAWNNAIYMLSDYLKSAPANNIILMDWGIMEPLQLLSRGKLPLGMGDGPVSDPVPSPDDRELVKRMISEPANLFIAHRKGFEFFPGRGPKLAQLAEEFGYRREMVRIVSDDWGREFFEVYRFSKQATVSVH
ncbi:MAG: glycosyltransferase family 39 protein [Acidobacteriia bacterium]|nr:glycosyltransferase family 39 protein [Terriglobia bacterium]